MNLARLLVSASLAALLGSVACSSGPSSGGPSGGGGKADGGECLFGEDYFDGFDDGTLEEVKSRTFWSAEEVEQLDDALLADQIIKAATTSTGDSFATLADVFEGSEASEVTVVDLATTKDGTAYRAIRFYPGGNAYGVIFAARTTITAAVFGDDEISACTPAAACTFGETYYDGIDAGTIEETTTTTYWSANEISSGATQQASALLGEQVLKAAKDSTGEDFASVAAVFEGSEASEVTVVELKADDGRRFRAIRFYPGGNAYGAIFKTGTVETAAMFGDDDIFVCHE